MVEVCGLWRIWGMELGRYESGKCRTLSRYRELNAQMPRTKARKIRKRLTILKA